MVSLFFNLYGNHRDLHVPTHSFPTRLSSDLHHEDLQARRAVAEQEDRRCRPHRRYGLVRLHARPRFRCPAVTSTAIARTGEAPGTPMATRTEIGRAHVLTPVTNAHVVCRHLLENKKILPHAARTP